MFRNYFKIAWRNLWKNKIFSLINVGGLAIGLGCSLLLIVYINFQLSFDKFHSKADRIVRVIMAYSVNGSSGKGNFTSAYVLPRFKNTFPEIEDGVRILHEARIVRYKQKTFNEKGFLFADPGFFKIFDFKLLKGNASGVLANPYTLVLTESAAKKYFGNEDPIGRTMLEGEAKTPFTVSGISKDCPANSQIKFDIITSFAPIAALQNEKTYFNADYTTYLLLKNKNDIAALQRKIPGFMKNELRDQPGTMIDYELEPLTSIHLRSPYDAIVPNVSLSYLYIIAGIALLILLIACFTYINLSTAGTVGRAKEVGIRKISGARRGGIISQFMIESFVITTAAAVGGILIAVFFIEPFNKLAQTTFTVHDIFSANDIVAAVLLLLVTTFFAGSYPAIFLSRFREIEVVKGIFKNSRSGNMLRRSLIVFQFSISTLLIVTTFIINGQLKYIMQKKLGYNKENVVVLSPISGRFSKNVNELRAELLSNPSIVNVAGNDWTPVSILSTFSVGNSTDKQQIVFGDQVDENFIRTNGIELIAGNDFNAQDIKDVSNDNDSLNVYHYILNETAAKAMGWTPREAIGKKISLMSGPFAEVKGVVKDFHFASLHSEIKPLVLIPTNRPRQLLIRTTGQNLPATIAFIKNKFHEWSPDDLFDYHFLDDEYNEMYASEERIGKVTDIFSVIAIFLACLGLFGLSVYEVRLRTKETGVRKVLGASVNDIVVLLSGSFIKWVFLAFLISMPVSWIVMNEWLQSFAYRIKLSWQVFAIAGISVFAIALLTVSFQSIKAALVNPVESLRTE